MSRVPGALIKLSEERKSWRQNHPYGFVAKPTVIDGRLNLLIWDCLVPGKKNTAWERGRYRLRLYFTPKYPLKPPKCRFIPSIFHPNISNNGFINLPVLERIWQPTLTVKHVLFAIQEFLANPDIRFPVNTRAYTLYRRNRYQYIMNIQRQAITAGYKNENGL